MAQNPDIRTGAAEAPAQLLTPDLEYMWGSGFELTQKAESALREGDPVRELIDALVKSELFWERVEKVRAAWKAVDKAVADCSPDELEAELGPESDRPPR